MPNFATVEKSVPTRIAMEGITVLVLSLSYVYFELPILVGKLIWLHPILKMSRVGAALHVPAVMAGLALGIFRRGG